MLDPFLAAFKSSAKNTKRLLVHIFHEKGETTFFVRVADWAKGFVVHKRALVKEELGYLSVCRTWRFQRLSKIQ